MSETETEAPARLTSGYPGRMLGVIALGTVLNMAGRVALPALLPTVIETFAITPTEAGFAVTATVGGIALTQFPGGRLADELTRKTVLAAAYVLFIIGFLLLTASPTYAILLVGAVVIGIGQGLYLPTSFAELSALFVARRGRALGINGASFSLGSAIGPALGVAALAIGSWRLAFLPVAILLVGVLGLLHFWNRQPYRIDRIDLELKATLARLTGSRPIRRSLLAFGLVGFVWQGGINFVPTLLQLERGFSPVLASATFSGLFILGAIVNPIAGGFGDRVGYPTVGGAGLLVAVLGVLTLVSVPGRPAAALGVVLFGIGNASFWPAMDAYVLGKLPDGSMGGDFGALNTANLVVGSLGPTYVGFVAERASYTLAFAGFTLPFLAAIGILWTLRHDRG
ncbi:MAG: MFS transporter [Halobacteriales archaeon]|nr:MFS transporter [Halobacteriales archaeon]